MLFTSSDTRQTLMHESILVYKFLPERTGFKRYAYTQLQLTFLALVPWLLVHQTCTICTCIKSKQCACIVQCSWILLKECMHNSINKDIYILQFYFILEIFFNPVTHLRRRFRCTVQFSLIWLGMYTIQYSTVFLDIARYVQYSTVFLDMARYVQYSTVQFS